MVKLSKTGAQFIANFEGFRASPYRPVPSERWLTIGYGHYGPDVKPGQRVTRAQALVLLRQDAHTAANAVRRLVKVRLNQCEFDALVSLTYNIGVGGFSRSSVLRELNRGHRWRAGLAFMMWVRGGGGPLPGLVRRRRAERLVFRGKTGRRCGQRKRAA